MDFFLGLGVYSPDELYVDSLLDAVAKRSARRSSGFAKDTRLFVIGLEGSSAVGEVVGRLSELSYLALASAYLGGYVVEEFDDSCRIYAAA